jgi:hypothetical protein
MREERIVNSNRQLQTNRMEISFKRPTFENVDQALSYEWIETDTLGNYSYSTILGLNTNKRQGLFVLRENSLAPNFMVLSHLQEELYQGDKEYSLHNTEYESNQEFHGVRFQTEFALDPFPTFTYQLDELKLEKSIFLANQANRLIVYYKLSGKIYLGCRIVIRPFFGFRPADSISDPELFKNMETFFSDRQIRYLPFQDAPEIFIFYSEGQFINAPVWYHDFYFRADPKTGYKKEDLLNLGFFDIPLSTSQEFYLSFGLGTTSIKEIKEIHRKERERRKSKTKMPGEKEGVAGYLSDRINQFQVIYDKQHSYFNSEPFIPKLNLSTHCFMAKRLLQSLGDSQLAQKLYDDLLFLMENKNLVEIFSGVKSDILVNLASPFYIAFFLYSFHNLFGKLRPFSSSYKIVQEVLNIILKNQLPYYRCGRKKLLERQYRSSDLEEKYDHEMYFPLRQNLVLNVLWYNTLKVGEFLAEAIDESPRRYAKYARKLQKNFFKQFMKSFSLHPSQALDSYKFAFHPAMIYTISLPFPILEKRDEQLLYRVLIKQFLSSQGIKFPIRRAESTVTVYSPLLACEYLTAWQKLMPEKESVFVLFRRMATHFKESVTEGALGFVPDALGKFDATLGTRRIASGPATSEVVCFLTLLDKIEKEQGLTENNTVNQ